MNQFITFLSHAVTFGFQASSPSADINLNPANKGIDKSHSDFQTAIGAAADATLDTESLFLITGLL